MANGELSRQVTTITSSRGWEVLRTLSAGPGELRVLVSGPSFPFDAVLSVRTDAPGCADQLAWEVRARQDSRSEHIVGVLDVIPHASTPRATQLPALLLEHAPGGTLAVLLARGEGLRPHEAATVLVGAASGLAALHEAGWAHTAVTTATILFRRDGCPALDGLEDVQPLDRQTADRDRDAFQRLVEAVCASVPSPVSWRMLTAASAALAREDWNAVVAGIVGVAEPGAVDLAGARPVATSSSSHDSVAPAAEASRGILALLLDGNPVAELLTRLREVVRTRRRLVIVVAAPLVAAAAILAAVPPGGEPRTSPTAHASGAPRLSPSASAPQPARSPDAVPSADPPSTADPVTGDDPVAAAMALLETRHRCFSAPDRSPDCLADVLQQGAALVSAEVSALGQPDAAQKRDFRSATFTLVQRWGEAALVSCVPDTAGAPLTKPASFLLVRNEAGWRIRDAFGD